MKGDERRDALCLEWSESLVSPPKENVEAAQDRVPRSPTRMDISA